RAFGDNILGFAPALCYGPAEFEQLFARLTRVLDEVHAELDVRQAVGSA
ncbi:MAG: aspartate aminotransferase family protein, partial [Gammaproteobacteria bacterium]|nr:aspartate aminotransferase family protein [Gammaproteobacteria bacterium]